METVKLSEVLIDEEQPRKFSDAAKMFTLRESIEKDGIMSPLIVEKTKEGKYLLIDGERRFRTARDLKFKEVPIIVIKTNSPTERLVKQFNIQEQHEGWTPVEKAVALTKLSDSLGMTILETCKYLNMNKHTTEVYSAFSELIDKKGFMKSEINIDYAKPMRSIKRFAAKLSEQELDEEFTRNDEMALEKAMVHSVKSGAIKESKDLVKLKDAFKKNPKLIKKYMNNDEATPQSLFVEAKAKGAYHLRNIVGASNHLVNNCRRFIEQPDVKVTVDELARMRSAYDALGSVIKIVD
ncbi:MAG TPA: ParB/RepB/Spo0J family partition protein [Rhabdochlamydiaceae bacterium]